jgi:hypothetical protein
MEPVILSAVPTARSSFQRTAPKLAVILKRPSDAE